MRSLNELSNSILYRYWKACFRVDNFFISTGVYSSFFSLTSRKARFAEDGLNAVANDFIKIMSHIIRQNTAFLDFFWHNLPIPSTHMGFSTANFAFILLFFLMFVGQALSASGNRMNRQLKFIKESIEDHLIFERAKGVEVSKEDIEAKITIPRHTIFQQFFILYMLPLIIGGILYFMMNILGW